MCSDQSDASIPQSLTRAEEGLWLSGLRRHAAVAVVLAGMALVVLDSAIVNIALPTMSQALHSSPAMSVRVVTGYQMGLMIALLPCAALGESLGFRRVFTAGAGLFAVASALCALSSSIEWLIAARFLQGLGGAAVMALSIALLRFIVPPQQLGAAIGWNALTVALAYAAGPTFGAIILSRASWPWLFAINVPLGLAVLLGSPSLPRVSGTGRRIDIFSVALNSGGFAALVIGAELLPTKSLLAGGLLGAAVLGFIVLVRRELQTAVPLVPIDLLRVGTFRLSVITSVFCFAGQMMGLVALPFYLQHGLRQDPVATAVYLTPWPLALAVASPIAGRLVNRVSTARLCAVGGLCLSGGLWAASLSPLDGNLWLVGPITAVCGLGCGLFQVPNNRIMFLSAPRERSGAAGGMQATARLAGQIVGAVLITMLFALLPSGIAPRIGLGLAAVLTMLAGAVSVMGGPLIGGHPLGAAA